MKLPSVTPTRIALVTTAPLASVVIGGAAWLLKWLIRFISETVTSGFNYAGGSWYFILTALTGILIVGFLVRRVVRAPMEHATELLKQHLKEKNGNLPLKMSIYPIIMSALTLGAGGSAGAEAPIALAGGAIGSNIARFFRLDREGLRIFMACGAGAGIAAIFKSPVGGMFFAIEVLRMQAKVGPLLMLGAMCVIADLTELALTGFTPDITPPGGMLIFEWPMLIPSIFLGIAGGAYSAYYLRTARATRRWLEKIKRPIVRNIASGLGIGISVAMFPALFSEGYRVLAQLAADNVSAASTGSIVTALGNNWAPIAGLTGILLLKGFASSSTNSGGGVAGEFTPTLFAGGVLGALFHVAFPGTMPMPAAIICGMAAGMSGIIRAPLMSIFIVTEMTQTPGLMLPVCTCVVMSLFVSKLLTRPEGPHPHNLSLINRATPRK